MCGECVSSDVRLGDRDYRILNEVYRWRVCLGRHLCSLAKYTSTRACDRRLRELIDARLLERKKILYGVPSIYFLTHRAKVLIHVPRRKENIKIEQISHDISVLDTAIYIHNSKGIPFEDMTTEKQLHSQDGFGNRAHRPDFVFTYGLKTICVEVELTLKAKARLEKNIKDNFSAYDQQLWVVPDFNTKIYTILKQNRTAYPNIEILDIGVIKNG